MEIQLKRTVTSDGPRNRRNDGLRELATIRAAPVVPTSNGCLDFWLVRGILKVELLQERFSGANFESALMTSWYILRASDGRFVTNDLRTGVALTPNLALAYVWDREDRAESQRVAFQAILGHSLLVEPNPATSKSN